MLKKPKESYNNGYYAEAKDYVISGYERILEYEKTLYYTDVSV